MDHFEVLVIGAGFSGLAAAKSYLLCAPDTNLVILDDNKTIGGVWAKEKIYEGLRTNNLKGNMEFPDFPYDDRYNVKDGDHIPGMVVHQYLNSYAQKFDLVRHIRLQTKVLEVEKYETGWKLLIRTSKGTSSVTTDKLIVSTGLTSKPAAMHIKGEQSFEAPVVNSAHLATEAPPILKDPNANRITVFGGSKFSYDTVYKFASAGKQVDWIIRKSGHGPAWMFVPFLTVPFFGHSWVERLVTRRIFAAMSPCYWGGMDGSSWWRWFLHETWLGRKIVAGFWSTMSEETLKQSGYLNHPDLKPLIPDCSMFDMATSVAVLNFPTDVLEYVRSGQVRVHRQDISRLSRRAVHLQNGTVLPSDAFIASTGWIWGPTVHFKDKDMHSDLGIQSTDYSPSQKAFWAKLDARADQYLFCRYPMLRRLKYPPRADEEDMLEQPLDILDDHPSIVAERKRGENREYQPTRYYHGIAPPGLAARGDRSLAFAGFAVNISHIIKAELTGLWIYAYFTDQLTVDPARDVPDVHYQTALFQRFCFRRYPYGFGRRFPDFVFDAIPWNDVLLKDLGLNWMRKGGGLWREFIEPYTPADYRGVTLEWLAARDQKDRRGKKTK